jgi:N-acetylmuramoyl-L-alanine amidase
MDTNGWNDIAYNFLVCKHGYVFVGRGWNVRSAATGDANSHTIACCFLGDDTRNRDDLKDAGRHALLDVAKDAFATEGVKRFSGHRDHTSTQCPGDEIYRYIHSADFVKKATAKPKPKRTSYDVRVFDNKGKMIKRWPRSLEPGKQLHDWNIAKNKPKRITIDRVDP